MKITNIAKGPRGIHTLAGSVVINPGQSIEADLSDAELKGSKETGWFEIGKGAAKKQEDNGDTKLAADVLAMADGNFMAFKSAASKLLGDKTPDKKAEIVAALEELATKPE